MTENHTNFVLMQIKEDISSIIESDYMQLTNCPDSSDNNMVQCMLGRADSIRGIIDSYIRAESECRVKEGDGQ